MRGHLYPLAFAQILALAASGCGRQPCNEARTDEGPQVRLDTALGTCNYTPIAHIDRPPGQQTKNSVVRLDGGGSSDRNGDVLSFQWTLIPPADSSARISNSTGPLAEFSADRAGAYEVSLVVGDGDLQSAAIGFTIRVLNQAPISDAGQDAAVEIGALVQLRGDGSNDPDGDDLTYRWTLTRPTGSTATLDDPGSVRPQFVADVRGLYLGSLTVSDGDDSTQDTVQIGAGVSIYPPVANAGQDQMGQVGTVVTLDGSLSTDLDGDPLTYAWRRTAAPSGTNSQLSDLTAQSPRFTPDRTGTYTFELIVNDGAFSSVPDTVDIVTVGNPTPQAIFDPSAVYMLGSLPRGTVAVVCEFDRLDFPIANIPGGPASVTIHPVDGSLQYIASDGKPYMFVPDEYHFDTATNRWVSHPNPVVNDIPVPTTACDTPVRIVMHPSTGSRIYECEADLGLTEWYDEAGDPFTLCLSPLALGFDGSVFCGDGIVDAQGVKRRRDHFWEHRIYVDVRDIRARREGGFYYLRLNGARIERWLQATDGVASLDHTYADYPAGTTPRAELDEFLLLSGDGSAYSRAYAGGDTSTYIMVRFTGNTAEIIYDGSAGELCQFGSYLFTGP